MINTYKEKIIVDLSDLYGFQRKAQYVALINNDEHSMTAVRVRVSWFLNGQPFTDQKRNIMPYEREIIADNTTLADAATGLPVMDAKEFAAQYQYQENVVNEEGDTITATKWRNDTPTTYYGEGDLYRLIRDTTPVLLKDLIISAIQRADQRGII